MNKRSISFIFIIIALIATALTLNIQVTTKYGKDYVLYKKQIPLYLKALNFIDRHLEYKQLTGEITVGYKTDNDKVLSIFDWVVKNIKKQPKELPVVDDHQLNIIIRGYGVTDQFEDVFTVLCTYGGFEAFYKRFTNSRKESYFISFVRIKNDWYPFSAYSGTYLLKNNKIYSIKDVILEPSILHIFSDSIENFEADSFLDAIENMPFKATSMRVKGQSPLGRIMFYIKNIF